MKALKIIFSLSISALFLFLALRGLNFSEVATIVSGAAIFPLIIATAVFIISYVVRTLRWKLMLRPVYPTIPIRCLLSAIFIGAAANNVLPLRAGEVVRSYAIKRFGDVSGKTALSSIVLERVLDGLSLLIILGILMVISPFPRWVGTVGLTAITLFGVTVIVLAVAFNKRNVLIDKLNAYADRKNSHKIKWIADTALRIGEGLSLFKSPSNFILAMAVSLGIWMCEALVYYLIGTSLSLELNTSAVFFCLVIVNFGLIIPSSPGFVGTFEYACVISLGIFQVSQSQAMGFAILLHAIFWVILVVAGFSFAWIDHGGLGKIAKGQSL